MGSANGRKAKASGNTAKPTDEVAARREALKRWLDLHGLNANEAARKAKISVSAIYNFLNGDTKSLSSTVLNKLAVTNNSSVDAILNGTTTTNKFTPTKIKITYRVGARGSMFLNEDKLVAAAPAGVALPSDVSAAVVDGDGLAPIPDGWTIFFRSEATEADRLVGKLATVRYSGGGDRPVIRTILRSQFEGLHTLKAMDGTITEDVKIVAAHEIVSMALTEISPE
jgi:transcriptional regulator with XRE-family HTH domain